jgi:hypothetical protein
MTISAYTNHPIRASIERILSMQSAPEFADVTIAGTESHAFARDRIFGLAHVIQSLLSQTPAQLASIQGLNQLEANIQNPLNELTNFLANKNPAHILNAATQFDQNVQPLLWSFAPQYSESSKSDLPKILEAQAEAAQESINQLVIQRDGLANRLAELQTKSDEYAKSFETLTTGSAQERAEAAATVAKLEQLFAQNETTRAATFDTAVQDFRTAFNLFETQTNSKSNELIGSLTAKKEDASLLLEAIGNTGITGNYQKIAGIEATQANRWRLITIAIFGAGIGVAAATFYKFWDQPFTEQNTWSVIIRLLYAIAITAPAWYTAKESARHRTNSDRAKQTELELASLGPFIELMDAEKKNEIREQLVKQYFGKTIDVHAINTPVDASAIKDLIELAKAIKK